MLLILSALIFSCGKNDNGRYAPMGKGVLDTSNGDLYEFVWGAKIEELQEEAFSKITGVRVTNLIRGTRRQFDFVDETKK